MKTRSMRDLVNPSSNISRQIGRKKPPQNNILPEADTNILIKHNDDIYKTKSSKSKKGEPNLKIPTKEKVIGVEDFSALQTLKVIHFDSSVKNDLVKSSIKKESVSVSAGHETDISEESDWEEVGHDHSKNPDVISSFDKDLIEKITKKELDEPNLDSTSYIDVLLANSTILGTGKASATNGTEDGPSTIQISLATGGGKNVKIEPGLTEEEKRLYREEVRRKVQTERRLKQLEKIHKAHLLGILAHTYYVNSICNVPAFRNLLVTLLTSTRTPAKTAISGDDGSGGSVPKKNTRNRVKKVKGTATAEPETTLDRGQVKGTAAGPTIFPMIYSHLKNTIDVPAIIRWLQDTFSSTSLADNNNSNDIWEPVVSQKNLFLKLMICAYKRLDPEYYCTIPNPLLASSCVEATTRGKKRVGNFTPVPDPTCKIGYINLLAITLLRSLGIETRLVVNICPTPLKIAGDDWRGKSDGSAGGKRHPDGTCPNKSPDKKKGRVDQDSPCSSASQDVKGKPNGIRRSPTLPKPKYFHPTVQYWLEARLEEDPIRKKSPGHDNGSTRWMTINCVKSVTEEPKINVTKSPEAQPIQRTGPKRNSKTGANFDDTFKNSGKRTKVVVSPYFRKEKASSKIASHRTGSVETPEQSLKSLRLPKVLSYVVALSENKWLRDLTPKYSSDWHIAGRKLRIGKRSEEHGWWNKTLERLNSTLSTPHVMNGGQDVKMWKKDKKINSHKVLKREQDKVEEMEILAVSQKRPLPTSITEYKDHPLYVLKRHLLRHQAIHPSDIKPVGYVRNEPVYSRENMHSLKARINWLKDDARLVRVGEKGYKLVLKRPSFREIMRRKRLKLSMAQGADPLIEAPSLSDRQNVPDVKLDPESELNNTVADPGQKEMEELFGIWQTDPFIPLPVVDGKIPRNTFGNVELFQMSMLPLGTVYVRDLPGLNKVANKFGLECVPAMRGWEFSRCSAHPVLDGWVILEKDQEKLLDEWDKQQVKNQISEFQKREKIAIEHWRKLTRALLIRERIRAKYGKNCESQYNGSEENGDSGARKPKKENNNALGKRKRVKKSDDDAEMLSTKPSNSPWDTGHLKPLPNTVLDLASYSTKK